MQGRRDFGHKLQEQLNHIKAAAENYDRGEVEAAQNIATALRIIFHDKGRQTSLLTHLDKGRQTSLLTHLERVMNLICRLDGGAHHRRPVSVVEAAD